MLIERKNIKDTDVTTYLSKKIKINNLNRYDKISVNLINKNSNSAFVYKVDLGKKSFFLKHAKEFVKNFNNVKVKKNRLFFEYKAMEYFDKILNKGVVPEVVFFDKKENILLMTDLSKGKKLLSEEFEKGKLYEDIGYKLGKYLKKIHTSTIKIRQGKENEYIKNISLKFKLAEAIKLFPAEVKCLKKKSIKNKPGLLWGDPLSKNMLVKKNDVSFLDFEEVVKYDPAYELGFVFANWIKLLLQNKNKKIFYKKISFFIKNFSDGYFDKENKCKKEMSLDVSCWTAVALLYLDKAIFKHHQLFLENLIKGKIDIFNYINNLR
jgi:5-methylthioribose kinase